MSSIKKVLMVYDYFDPAYKAGGPIASCTNLVKLLKNNIRFLVYTSNKDLGGMLIDVNPDSLTKYAENIDIIYSSKSRNFYNLYSLLRSYNPDVVHLNGIFSIYYVLTPLIILKFTRRIKIIISPRGMLQVNALSKKSFKKKVYLIIFKLLLKKFKIIWHVTSDVEKKDLFLTIKNITNEDVVTIGNVPRLDIYYRKGHELSSNLRLVTIAVISPMKNILKVLSALKYMSSNISYTLYGPIKDDEYWDKCLSIINTLPNNISFSYKGSIPRNSILQELSKHDIYIQPSESENFGHSIFEALMVGLPVITSINTPWLEISHNRAGWIVNPDSNSDLNNAISSSAQLTGNEYEKYSLSARLTAEEYLKTSNIKYSYLNLLTD